MIEKPGKGPGVPPLTPQEVKKYLAKKPEYKKIWDELIPEYFEAQEFCNFVNYIRIKRIQETEKINQEIQQLLFKKERTKEDEQKIKFLKAQKNEIFPDLLREVFNNQIMPKIKKTSINFKEVNQLIGSLANFNRSKKEEIEEITQQVNSALQENFSYINHNHQPSRHNIQFIKENNTISDVEEEENSDLFEYEDEILRIIDNLSKELFRGKDIGNAINQEEKRMFAVQAREIFLSNHKKEIQKGEINIQKLYNYLCKKKIL